MYLYHLSRLYWFYHYTLTGVSFELQFLKPYDHNWITKMNYLQWIWGLTSDDTIPFCRTIFPKVKVENILYIYSHLNILFLLIPFFFQIQNFISTSKNNIERYGTYLISCRWFKGNRLVLLIYILLAGIIRIPHTNIFVSENLRQYVTFTHIPPCNC